MMISNCFLPFGLPLFRVHQQKNPVVSKARGSTSELLIHQWHSFSVHFPLITRKRLSIMTEKSGCVKQLKSDLALFQRTRYCYKFFCPVLDVNLLRRKRFPNGKAFQTSLCMKTFFPVSITRYSPLNIRLDLSIQ